jgi:serine protease Do
MSTLSRLFAAIFMAVSLFPSPASAKADPQIEAAVQAVYPALVRIHVVSEKGRAGLMQKGRGSGSGTIISPNGYILTNHHVADRATRITVRLADRQEIRANLVGTNPLADLAVLKIDKNDLRDPSAPLPVAKFVDSASLEVGDVVLAMGSPAGISQSVTQGIVANTEMIAPGGAMRLDGEVVGELVRWIGHDAIIFPGNSGGPLVNLCGEIIGVNEIGIGSLGGASPSNLARKVSEELTTIPREPAEPREKELLSMGITARDLTELNAKELLRADNNAVLIQSIRPGGAAAASKPSIVPGDLILEVAGKPTPNIETLIQVSAEITDGKTEPIPTLIAYEHDGRSYLTVVKIGPEPEVDKPGLVKKAWIGIDTQVISSDLAEALGIPGSKGVRVTRVHPGSSAETAG